MKKISAVAVLACMLGSVSLVVPAANADERSYAPMAEGSVPPPLTTEQMSDHPDASWYAVSTATGDLLSSEDEVVQAPTATPPGEVGPFLIDDPVAWTACFVQRDENYSLASYQWWTASGPMIINLTCGYHNAATNKGTGWHHIAGGHEQDWRNRIIQTGQSTDGAGWDDLMAWQIQEAMNFPAANENHGSGKRCVGTPVMMYEADGSYVYTFYPSTIFTEDSKIVITSIPGSSYTC